MLKVCARCREAKSLDDFYCRVRSRDGRQAYCKSCCGNASRQWAQANPERVAESRLQFAYGLSLEEYHRLVEQQGGRCGICRRVRRLVVDHDHDTGRVRGLLCHKCNIGLGTFDDSTELFLAAIRYVNQ